jgi:hypothetical protein
MQGHGKSRSKTTEFIIGNESSADFEECGSEILRFFEMFGFGSLK